MSTDSTATTSQRENHRFVQQQEPVLRPDAGIASGFSRKPETPKLSYAAWRAQTDVVPARSSASSFAGSARLSFQNLRERVVEMSQCAVVDEARAYHYMNLVSQYLLAREVRLDNFLERHNLTAQFLAEDGAGKR